METTANTSDFSLASPPEKSRQKLTTREKMEMDTAKLHRENISLAQKARKLQSELINSQMANTTEEILGRGLFDEYRKMDAARAGQPLTFSKTDQGEFGLRTLSNNIQIFQKRRRMKNVFFFFKRYEIEDFFFIDRESRKAWNLTALLRSREKDGHPFEIIAYPHINNSGVAKTKAGHTIISNFLNENENANGFKKKMKISGNMEEIFDIIAPLHEIGHHFQKREKANKDSLEMTMVKEWLAKKFLLPIVIFLMDLKIGEMFNFFRVFKERITWQERNPHAFALATVHKLRSDGLDLLRGYDTDEVKGFVDTALLSYDYGLGIKFPGLPYSQKLRKSYRQAGM